MDSNSEFKFGGPGSFSLTYINLFNICIFVPTSRNGALIVHFEFLRSDFENSNKLKIILVFLFFMKI